MSEQSIITPNKPIVCIIAAIALSGEAKNPVGVFGYKGDLPWRGKVPEDMERFRKETMGNTVMMGRCTYYSIDEKYRPLRGRRNVVLSSQQIEEGGVEFYKTLSNALQREYELGVKRVFIIGGKRPIQEALKRGIVDEVYLTIIHKDYAPENGLMLGNPDEHGYTLFNQLTDLSQYYTEMEQVGLNKVVTSATSGIEMEFKTYFRKKIE